MGRIDRCSNHRFKPNMPICIGNLSIHTLALYREKSLKRCQITPNLHKTQHFAHQFAHQSISYHISPRKAHLTVLIFAHQFAKICKNTAFRSPIRSPICLLHMHPTNKSPHSSKVRSPIRSFILFVRLYCINYSLIQELEHQS